jgi:hypothetical protein
VVALGSPVENCGFAGVVTEWKDGQLIWRVLLRNYGRTVQTRNWWSVVDGGRGPVNQITLQPGQLDEVQGAFPADGKTIELVLEGDGFGLDDRLALVKPEPKKIFYRKVGNNDFGEFLGRLMATFNNVEPAPPGPADLELAAYDPALGRFPKGRGLVFLDEGSGPRAKRLFSGMVIAENHPLVDDLNWRGLVCSGSLEILGADGDEVLVWQGSRPPIFLRKLPEGGPPEARLVPEGGRQLVFNFDPRFSNAERLPAFVLLCHRFVESGRAEKVEFEAVNVDTRQRLGLAVDRMGAAVALRPGTPEIPAMQASILRAPADPGFFEVVQGDRPLLRGAAHFADAREADFMGADSFSSVENKVATLATRNSRQDFLTPVWVLLLTGALLGTWYLQGRRVG